MVIKSVHKSCEGKYHARPASSFIGKNYILSLPRKKFFLIFKNLNPISQRTQTPLQNKCD
jgi:hypothetical protein